MEKKIKKPYERPLSTCTTVVLESPLCVASDFVAASPHGANGIDAQPVDTDFSRENTFAENAWNNSPVSGS